ncbi:hypothetical protein CNR22_09025 [Sphingobacteriaceae bacterium]|nr:hypothetical protein CNR22_09025 [Sphingobacteriaceae bacterium]
MKSISILTAFIWFIHSDVNAQTKKPTSIGFGISSTVPFQTAYGDFPSICATPYLNIKFKRQEILIGTDFYFMGPRYDKEQYPLVIGGQGEYRYHFLKPDKRHNFFINTSFQYIQFQNGCGLYARPYAYSNKYVCNDAVELKNKSLINTYGVGIESNFMKRFYIYLTCGFGYNYLVVKGVYDNTYNYGNRITWTSTLRAGLSFAIYKPT